MEAKCLGILLDEYGCILTDAEWNSFSAKQ